MAVESSARLKLDDVLVVDVDVHAHETPTALLPYIDPAWREPLDNLTRVPWRYLDMPAFGPNHRSRTGNLGIPRTGLNRETIVWSAEQMRRELDGFSIDVGVLFPDAFLKLSALPNGPYAAAIARSYHRWLEAEWLGTENDLYGAIIALPQDPDDAVREIERYADHPRFVCIFLPTCQVYPLWGHPKYWPIFEAAEAAELPVQLHSVAGQSWAFPFNGEQFMTVLASHTVSHVFAMMANLMSFMENGVPARFPTLKIAYCEAGLTWVPFLRMRLDKEYSERGSLWPFYDRAPSEYIRKMYFATQPVEEPPLRRDLVDLIRIYDGEDTTVYASDWPHHDFDHPRAVFDLPVSDEAKVKIMGANSLTLFPKMRVPAKHAGRYPTFAGR